MTEDYCYYQVALNQEIYEHKQIFAKTEVILPAQNPMANWV